MNTRHFILGTALLSTVAMQAKEKEYLVASHRPNTITIVDTKGNVTWQHKKIKHPQDVDIMPDGSIFSSEVPGAQLIKRDHSVLWKYRTPKGTQNPVAQVLGNGRFLVGNEGPGQLLEIDSSGKTLKTIQLDSKNNKKHGQFRFCQKTPQGTYLVPLTAERTVKEYDSDGNVIQNFGTFNVPVSAIRLKNGNTLIGSFRRIDEFNPKGKCVWTYKPFEEGAVSTDISEQGHVTGMVEQSDGSIAFVLYHTNKTWPDILEVTKDKKITRSVVLEDLNKIAGLKVISE